jgi:hypothetical protein
MQAFTTPSISKAEPSSHSSDEKRVLGYIEVARLVGPRIALHLLRENLRHKWCIWRDAFRSFRGHIRTQSAIGLATVSLGQWNHRGVRNVRTVARRLYTQKLLAIRPWVDSQDLQIFIMGFDAGESWAGCNVGKQSTDQICARASWLTPESIEEINRILQRISASHTINSCNVRKGSSS